MWIMELHLFHGKNYLNFYRTGDGVEVDLVIETPFHRHFPKAKLYCVSLSNHKKN